MISILICTRDRTKSLPQTLESIFSPISLQESDWELVVVYGPADSGETRAICEQFRQKYPDRFRFFLEKKSGKSNALNSGMEIARGEILALTDDDVICAPDYVRSIREVFTEHPVDGAQGRVLLDCERGRPVWMGPELAGFMSQRDFGDRVFEWQDNLTGTNMIVKRQAALSVGGFSPLIGASAAGFMEDSEFSMRLRRSGCRFIFAPQILVRHQLPQNRLTKSFFRERYFRWGRSEAYLRPLPASFWRMTLYTARLAVWRAIKAFWLGILMRPAQAFFQVCEIYHQIGFAWQHWLFRRGHATPLYSTEPETSANANRS
jgi:cellulose synthase/poly-beta-1,6-N-acetylglucosamine synthase-like glycosyltransferase